jgi:UDP-GlcNAc:undecaprenyl-phosphate GlcNAc-1-phosphate transferase
VSLAAINPADNPLSVEFYRLLLHNFGPAVAPALVTMVVTIVLVPVTRRLSFRLGAVAVPGGRNIHARPTGRLGGIAMGMGFVAAAVAFALSPLSPLDEASRLPVAQVAAMVAIVVITVAVMTVDDVRALGPGTKLVLQLGLAVLTVVLGIAIHFINLGGGNVIQLGVLSIPVTLIWLMGMQNTMNLLDGVDGLAAGVAGIVAVALLLAAVNRVPEDASQLNVVLLCAAFAGACVGFLVFNFHPARIFMGDSGSHFLGIGLGILSIFGIAKGEVVFALVVPVAALAVPILDTAWAIVRRRRQRISIGHPDTEHVHHQLLDFGLSQRRICLVFYSATGITSGLGLMLYGHRKILAVVIVLLVVGLSTIVGDRLYELEQGRAEGLAGDLGEEQAEAGVLLES